MSEQNEESPAAPEAPAAKVAKKRPAVRKSAKPAAKNSVESAPAAAPESSPEPTPAPRAETSAEPPAPSEADASDTSDGGRIAFLVETPAPEPGGGSKKRRRRKKKHGQGAQGQPQHPHAVSGPGDGPGHAPSVTSAEAVHAPAMHAAPRPKLEPEEVAKKAWKLFQSEVGEEGLALIDDHDAREMSRRCFRLAEIFLEEAARRSQR